MFQVFAIAAVCLLFCLGIAAIVRRATGGSGFSPDGKGPKPDCSYLVKVSESAISVQCPDGNVQELPLADIQQVAIVTNDSGPAGADVWWVLSGSSSTSGCWFPGGAAGEQAVLQFVQTLPGFDNERFIQAMGSTSNARFLCWTAGTLAELRKQ